ncbi:MAG: hypothetical protein WD928_18080, partial [Gammaproteobacteria bacterium]
MLFGHCSGSVTDHLPVPALDDLNEASNRVGAVRSCKSAALHRMKRRRLRRRGRKAPINQQVRLARPEGLMRARGRALTPTGRP